MGEVRGKSGLRSGLAGVFRNWMGAAEYIRTNTIMAGSVAFLLLLFYGKQAFTNYYYVDKEALVNNPGSFYNWQEIGRFGLILIKKILNLSWYNPYFHGVLLLLALWLTAMAAGYLFHMIDSRLNPLFAGICGLIFLVHPVYAEQFLFQFQAFEVVLAIFLLIVSDWYLVQAYRQKDKIAFLAALPPALIAFGVYQSMVAVQLCLYFGIFLMSVYAQEEGIRESLRYAGSAALHFIIVFFTYVIIVRLFFSGSDYLAGQVMWKIGNIRGIIHFVREYFIYLLTVNDMYYTRVYGICAITALIALAVLFLKQKRRALIYLVGTAGVLFSPLFLAICVGTATPVRAQMMLPLASGLMWMFGSHVLCREAGRGRGKVIRRVLAFVGGMLIFINASSLMRLFYTRDIIGEADNMTALMMIDELREIPAAYEGKPLIFIGHGRGSVNPACFSPEETMTYVTMSAFEIDYEVEPRYYFSSYRILEYLKTLGFGQFQGPSDEMMPAAYGDCQDMPIWPLAGSIKEFEEYIIIKLGD